MSVKELNSLIFQAEERKHIYAGPADESAQNGTCCQAEPEFDPWRSLKRTEPASERCQVGEASTEICVENPQKVKKRTLLYDLLLGISPNDSTSYFTDTWSAILITDLFTIARKWRQYKCPSGGGWIKKMLWCIHIKECYSAAKKAEGWASQVNGWH